MAISLTHTTQTAEPNDPGYDVSATAWNEAHTITMATNKLLGRETTGTGAVEELGLGIGLRIEGGNLQFNRELLVKATDTERASTTTKTADPELVSATLPINAVFRLEALLLYTAGTAEDFSYQINRTGLSDAFLRYQVDLDGTSTVTWAGNINAAANGITTYNAQSLLGVLVTGTNPGVLELRWAQQASGVNITTLRQHSFIILTRLA